MFVIQSLLVYDMATMVAMLILLYLSRRLGEALKIAPWYRLLYITTLIVFIASGIDAFQVSLANPISSVVSMTMRVFAAIVALAGCLPYWKWLFSEYFFRQG